MRSKLFLLGIITTLTGFRAIDQDIKGIVRDADNKTPLAGASIKIMEDSKYLLTDQKGRFSIDKASYPTGVSIVVSFTGYQTDTIRLFPSVPFHVVSLRRATGLLSDVRVDVSGKSLTKENPAAITLVSAQKIDQALQQNLIDALVKNVPGLSAVKTGPNIAKPFIRGLGYNRVLTLYDGIRQEGQQWGDEHGIEIDPYGMEKAAVIKGPASLMYGSDALAGVCKLDAFCSKRSRRRDTRATEY